MGVLVVAGKWMCSRCILEQGAKVEESPEELSPSGKLNPNVKFSVDFDIVKKCICMKGTTYVINVIVWVITKHEDR